MLDDAGLGPDGREPTGQRTETGPNRLNDRPVESYRPNRTTMLARGRATGTKAVEVRSHCRRYRGCIGMTAQTGCAAEPNCGEDPSGLPAGDGSRARGLRTSTLVHRPQSRGLYYRARIFLGKCAGE